MIQSDFFLNIWTNLKELNYNINCNCSELLINEQDFDDIFIDGSYDQRSGFGGAAAIIRRKKTGTCIHFELPLRNCSSSTYPEIIAAYIGLRMAMKYKNIKTIKSDSQACIAAIFRSSNEKMVEKYHFWLVEIRNLLKLNVQVSFKWIKGHAGIIGNEIADRYAKRVRIKHQFRWKTIYLRTASKVLLFMVAESYRK